jgi:hypothetical protein
MRIPVAVTLESRDGTTSKDAKVVNGVLEPRGDSAVLRKRPGLGDLGHLWSSNWTATGTAQLLYPWNGLWAIYADYLVFGSLSAMSSPSAATWSTTDKGSNVTLSGSNLVAAFTASSNVMVRATDSRSSGKYYWEITVTAAAVLVGIAKSGATLNNFLGQDANGWAYQPSTGNKITGNVSSSYGATFTTGDVIGVALDATAGTLTFYKNGVSQGVAFSGLSGTFYPAVSGNTSGTGTATANFGATAFSGTVPSGYLSGLGLAINPITAGGRFDAQEVGASAATQVMMIKNRTQAWTITPSGGKSSISFPSSMGAVTYSVTSLTRSGTTATASLSTDPTLSVGDSVTVAGATPSAYNGAQTITAVTPSSTTPPVNVTISSLTRSGTTATAVTSSAHGLTTATAYTIGGANEGAYNGSMTITVVNSTTFTYTVTVTPGTSEVWDSGTKTSGITLSGGNLTATATCSSSDGTQSVLATHGLSSGKWYWEVTVDSFSGGAGFNDAFDFGIVVGAIEYTYGGHAPGFYVGHVFGVAFDRDSGVVRIYDNNVLASTQSFVTAGAGYPRFSVFPSGASLTMAVTANFGATAFVYTPPSGYQAIVSDQPTSPATGSPYVTRPGVTTPASVAFSISGSPATPATGTITLSTSGGMVPGLPYIDGYFFVMDNNGVMWQSAIDDPTSWPALSNLTAQNENGKGKALGRSLNYLIAFKEWSTEFFYDVKVPNFSFFPADNGFTEVGCAAGESVAHVDGNLIWASQVKDRGRSVHLMTGLQQQKVSTPDLERILNDDDMATVYAYGLKLGGHSLYLLTLVTSNITLVYDLATQAWTQWSSLTAGNALTVSSITRSGDVATVTTSTAHGMSDGDPITIAGATQNEYNGTFLVNYVSTTAFTIEVSGDPLTPATGTITATPYTSSYFKFTKFCDYNGASLFLHESDGHLYQMLPSLNQDAGKPIDLFFRTSRLDGGSSEYKVMARVSVVGDRIDDSIALRYSDDDCTTFSTYERVDLDQDLADIRRLGRFRRRTLEGRHFGNTSPRIEGLEIDIS